jgi:GNAT superfamily N-acetyltransferase
MSASVGLTEERFMPFAGFYCRRAVGEGVSFVARKGRDGPIVGVGISGDLQAELSVEPPAAPEMAPIFQILDRLTADYLKMERDVGRVLHMNLAAVTRESEGRLIGQRLVQLTLQRARSLGYREAIGHIAARSLQLLFQHAFSFRELSRVEYATFEHEGARVFAHIRSPEAILLLGRDLDGEVEAAPAGALP